MRLPILSHNDDEDEDEDVTKSGSKRRSSDWLDYVKVLFMPVVVLAASVYLGEKQIESAETIARAQTQAEEQRGIAMRELQERIAEAERQAADRRKEAELNLQRLRAQDEKELEQLSQIKEIFKEIVAVTTTNDPAVATKIVSLAVYKQTSVPFLLRIEDHFCAVRTRLQGSGSADGPTTAALPATEAPSSSDGTFAPAAGRALASCDPTGPKSMAERKARETIRRIIYNSQLDLTDEEFRDEPLRFAQLSDYNLSGARFINTNLFSASLQRSTLKGACFENTDLVRTNFSHANLEGAQFIGRRTQLFETNFTEAFLVGVSFDANVSCLEKATFKLFTLLQVGEGQVFGALNPKTYAVLLANTTQRLRDQQTDDALPGAVASAARVKPPILSDFEGDPRFISAVRKVLASDLCAGAGIDASGSRLSDAHVETFHDCLANISAVHGKRCFVPPEETTPTPERSCAPPATDGDGVNAIPAASPSAATE